MSQHGCPERLSNRSKGFQDDGPSQSTIEVLVETLTGTAFEMTVLPTDTIFAIKSKIFRVEGIPVSQQHLLYNLVELEDASSLREHAISDGARLRLVLGMRGGPISTRRLPPPPNAERDWRDIERLLDTNRDEVEWGGSGCKVTVLVFRDGERVNMLRVKENHDGTYSPLDHNKYSSPPSSLSQLVERSGACVADTGAGSLRDNAVTMSKMLELRRRMETLSVQRGPTDRAAGDTHTGGSETSHKVELEKSRSSESLSAAGLLEASAETLKHRAGSYAPFGDDDTFAPLYDGNYTRYHLDCSFTDRYTLLPPIGTRADSEHGAEGGAEAERRQLSELAGSILVARPPDDAAILEECLEPEPCRQDSPQLHPKSLQPIQAEYGPLVCQRSPRSWVSLGGGVQARGGAHSHSASSLHVRAPPPRRAQPLADALFSSSTSDLEKLKRNSRILPALSRHRPRSALHLADELADAPLHLASSPPPARSPSPGPPEPAAPRRSRPRCAWCRKRLSICSLHRCRCGAAFCAPHRYAEVHGCAYDYRAAAAAHLARDLEPVHAPKLPRI